MKSFAFHFFAKSMRHYWRMRKSLTRDDPQRATAHLAERDRRMLAGVEGGRFFPIGGPDATKLLDPKHLEAPRLLDPRIRMRPGWDATEEEGKNGGKFLTEAQMRHGHWAGKFGRDGGVYVRFYRYPATHTPNFSRIDDPMRSWLQSGGAGPEPSPEDTRWGTDVIASPRHHGMIDWVYSHPNSKSSFTDPDVQREIYEAIRSLGIRSLSYFPLDERESNDPIIRNASGKDRRGERIRMFAPLLHHWHNVIGQETGRPPVSPADDIPMSITGAGLPVALRPKDTSWRILGVDPQNPQDVEDLRGLVPPIPTPRTDGGFPVHGFEHYGERPPPKPTQDMLRGAAATAYRPDVQPNRDPIKLSKEGLPSLPSIRSA